MPGLSTNILALQGKSDTQTLEERENQREIAGPLGIFRRPSSPSFCSFASGS